MCGEANHPEGQVQLADTPALQFVDSPARLGYSRPKDCTSLPPRLVLELIRIRFLCPGSIGKQCTLSFMIA